MNVISFNKRKYGELLAESVPTVIRTEEDIVHLFGSSGRASEAINGMRPISKIQAKALAEFFHVTTDLFLGV